MVHLPWVVTLSREEIRQHVQMALAEDIGSGDVTTLPTIPESLMASAVVVSREPLIVAGLALAEAAFTELASGAETFDRAHEKSTMGSSRRKEAQTPLEQGPTDENQSLLTSAPTLQTGFQRLASDGASVGPGQALLRVHGPARILLSAERVALNYLQRLSGIATLTSRYVDAVRGTKARILDTRKTAPGWRRLEKYAVTCGGGFNHRFGLYDQVLIKDNHLSALRQEKPNAITAAVQRARARYPALLVEVEADTLEQVAQAVEAGADRVLLDNMSLDQMRAAVNLVAGRAKLEASGGVSLHTVRAIAETGVDFISVGAITHSAPAVDIGLDFESS